MTVQELLQRAKVNGLTVSLEGGKLKVRTPQEPQGEVRALIEELRQHKGEVLEALTEEDPLVTQDIMMEEFRRLQKRIIGSELGGFDYGWIRENRRDLYGSIKAKEAEMEATEGQSLSTLLGTIREWIELVREGYREQTNDHV